jgi:hypothetical protein
MLACVTATSAAQQPQPVTQVLDEVEVAGPRDRVRERGPGAFVREPINVAVTLDGTIRVHQTLVKEQTQVVFHRRSAARRLPASGDSYSKANERLRLELLPDRLVALDRPWIRTAGYQILPNVEEADGVPAQIPFGPDIALVNLDYVRMRESQYQMRIGLTYAMHPQTRRCETAFWFGDFWSDSTNPYILLGNSLSGCNRAARRRDGDLLFADSVPTHLRQAVQEIYDPIASRLANRLGSEPGTMFIAWWMESPYEGYRLELSWNRNSLLLFNGTGWLQGIDTAQREALRMSFMREQIQRRIRESDWPGPFTQSAVDYLLLLTRSDEEQATPQRLRRELPMWMADCATRMHARKDAVDRGVDVPSLECGLVLQFVYDAVARSSSAGRQDVFSTWRKLLSASFRRGESGAKPTEFLASSADARRIAQGLFDGRMDWPKFAADLDSVGVKLSVTSYGSTPEFEVQSLEHF